MYHLKLEASHFNYFSDVSLGGFQNIVTTQGLTNATFLFLTFQGKSQNILKKKKLIDIVSFKMFFSALPFLFWSWHPSGLRIRARVSPGDSPNFASLKSL